MALSSGLIIDATRTKGEAQMPPADESDMHVKWDYEFEEFVK